MKTKDDSGVKQSPRLHSIHIRVTGTFKGLLNREAQRRGFTLEEYCVLILVCAEREAQK